MKVKDLMTKVCDTISGNKNILEAAKMMMKKNRGMLVVVEEGGNDKVVGVISNRDIVNRVVAKKMSVEKTLVSDIMSKKVISVTPDETTSKAMFLMRDNGIKRLIVMEHGLLQGLISSTDIVHSMIRYKKKLLDMALDF